MIQEGDRFVSVAGRCNRRSRSREQRTQGSSLPFRCCRPEERRSIAGIADAREDRVFIVPPEKKEDSSVEKGPLLLGSEKDVSITEKQRISVYVLSFFFVADNAGGSLGSLAVVVSPR